MGVKNPVNDPTSPHGDVPSGTALLQPGKIPTRKVVSSQSRRNALKDGLFANVLLLESESPRDFHALQRDVVRSLQPQCELELTLAHRIATILWRLRRFTAAEKSELTAAIERDETNATAINVGSDDLDKSPLSLRSQRLLVPTVDTMSRLYLAERHLAVELDRVLSQFERVRALRAENSRREIGNATQG